MFKGLVGAAMMALGLGVASAEASTITVIYGAINSFNDASGFATFIFDSTGARRGIGSVYDSYIDDSTGQFVEANTRSRDVFGTYSDVVYADREVVTAGVSSDLYANFAPLGFFQITTYLDGSQSIYPQVGFNDFLSISVSNDVIPIPLPGAAPLMGLALLALGYGGRIVGRHRSVQV